MSVRPVMFSLFLGAALLPGSAPAAQTPPPPTGLKHVALGSGDVWLSVSAQSRTRVEAWTNFGFGDSANHNAVYVLERLMLGTDLHVGTAVRGYVQVKSAFLTERDLPGGRRPADADDFDLQQGYLELSLKPAAGSKVAVRGGRQDLLFGKQRLVSPLDWTNTRRTFDALRGTLSAKTWTLDVFYARPVKVSKSTFNRSDSTVGFGGLHAQRKSARGAVVDFYWLALGRETAAFNGTSGSENRHTLGARAVGVPGQTLQFDVEAAYQFGTLGPGSIAAEMISVDVAYAPAGKRASPRLHAGLDFASGDGATGGDVGTFNQLFPLGHAFLGFIDVVGRQNVVAANIGLGLKPNAQIETDVTVHHFGRARAADALYNAGGGVERAAGTATELDVGTEVDLTAICRLGRYGVVLVGYSLLLAGDFIGQTGAAEDIGFFYSSLQLTY